MASIETRPIVTVDVALFTIVDDCLCLALIERTQPPFAGHPALIGGYLHPDEDAGATEAAQRILTEKAGLKGIFVEQLMTFAGPDRDPRGWSVSIAYYALVPAQMLSNGAGPASMNLVPVDQLPSLPFDHDHIVATAVARLRGKSSYSSLPTFLLPPEFTFPELKKVYETVMGTPLNDSAFRRKIGDLEIIEEVPEAKSTATAVRKRPAQIYRLRQSRLVEFDRSV